MKNGKIKTKYWVIILAVLCLGCAVLWLMLRVSGSGSTAVITLDGQVYDTIDLSRVDEPYDIEIRTKYGSNTVHVDRVSIAVTEADCPDRICVRQGAISQSGVPIVCMPHRLYISIQGGDIDG